MAIARANEVELFYEIRGSGSAFPVVLVMGLAVDSHGWDRQVPALTPTRRVLTLDNRGVGRSSKPKGPYTTEQMADDVIAVMDEAGIGRAHLIGVSLGGAIAQQVALRHGRRLQSLTLMCTFAKSDAGMNQAADGGAHAVTHQPNLDIGGMLQAAAEGNIQIDPKVVMGFLMPLVFTPAFREREKELLRDMYTRTIEYGFSPAGLAGQVAAAMKHDTTAQLATIGTPTLVVAAGRDRLVSPHLSRVLASGIPGAKLVEIENAPHGINLERADEVNAILVSWLADHD